MKMTMIVIENEIDHADAKRLVEKLVIASTSHWVAKGAPRFGSSKQPNVSSDFLKRAALASR
jgi:hypothetical protein